MSMKVWDSALALPKDIDDAEQLVAQLETLRQPPNPKFLSLAQALLADSAFAGHWGTERILEAAENCVYAIWEPSLPAGDAMPAIRAVIQHATALGLVAYRASRQAVFLPGGTTVTPEQKTLHDEDFAAYDARLSARAEVCQTLLKRFTEHFADFVTRPTPQEAVVNSQRHFTANRKRNFREHVERVGHATVGRVFHGHQAKLRLSLADFFEHCADARHGDQLG